MSEENECHSLPCGETIIFNQPQVLLLTAGEDTGCLLQATSGSQHCQVEVKAGNPLFFVATNAEIKTTAGKVNYRKFTCTWFTKLQAFLDLASGDIPPLNNQAVMSFLAADINADCESRALEYWYVNKHLNEAEGLRDFAAVLRNTEWYRLVSFLLSESELNSGERIQNLCSRYGLSSAHFRRLSSYALGKTTKVELKDWRLVRALLDFMGSDKDMTTIAMDHGYSSLSHFSSEVKDKFGISVRGMKKIITDGQKE